MHPCAKIHVSVLSFCPYRILLNVVLDVLGLKLFVARGGEVCGGLPVEPRFAINKNRR
jgi:hypothetical protein